jgi:hypothetical protein
MLLDHHLDFLIWNQPIRAGAAGISAESRLLVN